MREFQVRTSHRPRPLPTGRWATSQRWNDLLFAHWPVAAAAIAPLLPEGLQVDTFQGSAWLGIVPFWLDRLKVRGMPRVPIFRNLPDLNLPQLLVIHSGVGFILAAPANCCGLENIIGGFAGQGLRHQLDPQLSACG